MNKAAIILEDKGFGKSASMLLGKPYEADVVSLQINGEEYKITILQIPYCNTPESLNKTKSIIEKYCYKKGIPTIIYKKIEDEEINKKLVAIKIVCLLRLKGNENKINLFEKRFGIIFDNLNPYLIDALSQKAFGMIIFDREFERDKTEKLYQKIIKENGLSIVYTKDLTVIIKKSDIILCEDTVILRNYEDLLFDKITLFNDWNKIILLPSPIYSIERDSFEINCNDEIIKTFLTFNEDMSTWDGAKCFNSIYAFDK